MSTRIRWNGAKVLAKVQDATAAAIDETTEDAARAAGASHWWRNRTGMLDSRIVSEKAERRAGRLVGKFGTTQGLGFYGLFLERRNPFLRPAADAVFPSLAARIRGKL
jgi:hypothetical protein